MSLVIPPGYGVAAFVLNGSAGTAPYVTTIGLDLGEYGGDFVGAANDAFLAYASNIMPATSNNLTLDRVTLSVGVDGPGGSVDSDQAPVNGTSTGNFPPTACSVIARKITNELGRRGRGRMFLPGIATETQVEQDGSLTPAARLSFNTMLGEFYDTLVAGSIGIPMPPVLLHGPSLDPIPPTPITGLAVSDVVGWIRGRIR